MVQLKTGQIYLTRGGICHINEDTYMLFVAMEEEVQLNLQALQVKIIGQDNLKKKLLDSIASIMRI